jgi:hypothetical protein
MSACGLDECDLYGGCMFDCQYSRKKRGEADAMDLALIEDAKKLAQMENNK